MKSVNELIENRWSPRAFSDKAIENEKLQILFEAARRAPSSSNEQPWRYLVGIKGKGETWDKILSALDSGNQEWAKYAPVLLIVIAKQNYTKYQTPNKHKFYDSGQSMAFLTMQATTEGLFVHQMGGFSPEKISTLFNIPGEYEPITAVAIGYKGNPEILSEKNKASEMKRVIRKELKEIIFAEWNKSLEF